MSESVYIAGAKRSAVGKFGGAFVSTPATSIAAVVVKELLKPYPQLLQKVDEVIIGNVLSAGLGQNPARIVAMKAGLSQNIPAYTVNKVCGSGLKSITLGVQSLLLGESQLVIAGGMENMSRAPYLLENYRFGAKFGHQKVIDSMILDGLYCSLIDGQMGMTAENIARKYKVSRQRQDEYAYRSHQKALAAQQSGKFTKEIVPIDIQGKTPAVFSVDEQPRKDTSMEKLAKLSPVFLKNGTVTAGNASSLNDAAAMTLLASEKEVKQYGLKPLVRVVSFSYVALDPKFMGMGAYYAAIKSLKKASLTVRDIDLWEINEAFASSTLAVIEQLGVDLDRVNVNGGAIAFGHPIGASGARIVTTLIYELKRRKLDFGLATLCIGGGQGIALLVENVDV